jgi:hypothetical protein
MTAWRRPAGSGWDTSLVGWIPICHDEEERAFGSRQSVAAQGLRHRGGHVPVPSTASSDRLVSAAREARWVPSSYGAHATWSHPRCRCRASGRPRLGRKSLFRGLATWMGARGGDSARRLYAVRGVASLEGRGRGRGPSARLSRERSCSVSRRARRALLPSHDCDSDGVRALPCRNLTPADVVPHAPTSQGRAARRFCCSSQATVAVAQSALVLARLDASVSSAEPHMPSTDEEQSQSPTARSLSD